jgi:Zn-dependent protease with chaperone function
MTNISPQRKRLVEIAPDAYRHPQDLEATAALRSVPGLDLALGKLSRFGIEQLFYTEMCASAVKVTPKQCGRIHDLMLEACAVLDIPNAPPLFLTQTPIVNAFALGKENPIVVLHTGLVEHLTEEELLGVIAHELGHIQCGHTIYLLLMLLIRLTLQRGGEALGGKRMGDLISLQIEIALFEWLRKAEFSCDRAAVLVTQDPEIVFSALFKLTGGSPKIFEMMDRDEYLKQAEEYDRPDAGRLDKFYRYLVESGKTHPIPVLRAREVLRYGEGDEYKDILAGKYLRRDRKRGMLASGFAAPVTCPNCGRDADRSFSFCTHCGASLPETPAQESGAESEETFDKAEAAGVSVGSGTKDDA